MEAIKLNKDINYSLYNIKNYKKEFSCETNVITQKYSELLIEYFKFITENIKIKNEKLTKFIMIRGLNTITHVFLNILFYTKNIDITYYHCQKSFYFYVEFVCQISEDEKKFLQLTTRDATLYVYKKTIFEINNECKKINETLTMNAKEKISVINTYVNLYKTYIHKIIDNIEIKNKNSYIEIFEKISNKLNSNLLHIKNPIILEKVVVKLSNNINDVDRFFIIMQEIIKKIIKSSNVLDVIEEKILHEDFENKIDDRTDRFILWLTNK
jgi:hypothetical protein